MHPVLDPQVKKGTDRLERVLRRATMMAIGLENLLYGGRLREPGDLQRPQELSFSVEETSCRAPGMATATCKSRWFGAVSWCRGYAFLEQQQPMVELSCEQVPITLGPIRKSSIKNFFGRIKERFKGFFQCSKVWIRDKLNLKKPKS